MSIQEVNRHRIGVKSRPKLTGAQQRVLDFAVDTWQRDKPLLVSGPAGTGKTSMAQSLATALDLTPAYLAPTGKAAQVLRSKVGSGAFVGTIHSAVYAAIAKDPERYAELQAALADEHNPRRIKKIAREMKALASPNWVLQPDFVWQRPHYDGPGGIDAIVADEASMVGGRIGGELVETAKRFGLPMIAIGDFYQLPPVADTAYFDDPEAHIAAPELDKIVRQAEGSTILDLASHVRNGRTPRRMEIADELSVYPPVGDIDLWDFDMVLCGTNKTRHRINREMRSDEGYDGKLPQAGEPMILLRNDHARRIANGDLFTVEACGHDDGQMWITGEFDNGRVLTFPATLEHELHGTDMSGEELPVAFAYAITVHKSQGSEWPHVLVIDESRFFAPDASRWLYTAVTRAKEQLTLAKRV